MFVILTLFLIFISLFSKYFILIFYLFNFASSTIKLIMLLLNIYLIKYMLFYPYKQRLKLSYLRKKKYESYLKYKVQDHNELDISMCICYLYLLFFIILLMVSRFKNINKILDLDKGILKIFYLIETTSLFNNALNILLILCGIIFYYLTLLYFVKFIKMNFYKLYFYVYLFIFDHYELTLLNIRDYVSLNSYTYKIISYIPSNSLYLIHYSFIFNHIYGLRYIIHKVILIVVILYDLKYNGMILSHMFKLLPYVFFYELWVKFSIYLSGVNFNYDKIIALLLYGDITKLDHDPECIYLNGLPYGKTFIKELITIYAKNNFVDKQYLPEEPIKEGLNMMRHFWKNRVIMPILSKYGLDLLFFSLILIYFYVVKNKF